jgi:hypothetical protein
MSRTRNAFTLFDIETLISSLMIFLLVLQVFVNQELCKCFHQIDNKNYMKNTLTLSYQKQKVWLAVVGRKHLVLAMARDHG